MSKRMTILAAAAIFALFANGVSAQTFGGTWAGLGIHGGYITGYQNRSVEQSIKDAYGNIVDFKLAGSMHDVGADYRAFSGMFGLDLSVDYAWRSQEIMPGVQLRHNTLAAIGGVDFMIPFVISPYVGAGIGAFRTAQSVSNDNGAVVLPANRTNFGWTLKGGVGLDLPALPIFPFVEWRYFDVRTPNHPVIYDSILLGATFRF